MLYCMHYFSHVFNLTVFPFTGLFPNTIQNGNDPEFTRSTFEDNDPAENDPFTFIFDRTLTFFGNGFVVMYVSELNIIIQQLDFNN